MLRLKKLLLVVASTALPLLVWAAPYDFDGTPIEIPPPPGYVSTRTDPALYEAAKATTSQRSILIDHFMPREGAEPSRKTWDGSAWMIVQTPRGARGVELTAERFERLKAGTRTVDLQRALESWNDPALKAARIDAARVIGVENDTGEWFMYGTAAKVVMDGQPVPLIVVTSYCRIKGKLVSLGTYRVFRQSSDITVAKREARLWALAVLNANR